MRKTLIAAASGLALAAGTMTMPTSASADPVLIPALVAAGIGGLGLGAAAATANNPRYSETVVVPERQGYYAAATTLRSGPTVVPQGPCYWTRARVDGLWRRVQVCD